MDLLWMILLLFLVCAEAENVTEVKVELGQNVTLNCSVDKTDTYWYMEIHSQFQGCISRTFSGVPARTQYYVSTFRTKYSALENRLIITNITAEDCRLYFCARRLNDSIHFVDTIRLVSDVPVSPSNNCEDDNNPQQVFSIWKNEFVTYSSFILNALLVTIGLVCLLFCLKKKKKKKKKTCDCQGNESSPVTDENSETLEARQYEEIQLSTYRPRPAADPPECIYYKAQIPRSTLPGR